MLRVGIRFPFGKSLDDSLRAYVQYYVDLLFNALVNKYMCIPEFENEYEKFTRVVIR